MVYLRSDYSSQRLRHPVEKELKRLGDCDRSFVCMTTRPMLRIAWPPLHLSDLCSVSCLSTVIPRADTATSSRKTCWQNAIGGSCAARLPNGAVTASLRREGLGHCQVAVCIYKAGVYTNPEDYSDALYRLLLARYIEKLKPQSVKYFHDCIDYYKEQKVKTENFEKYWCRDLI